MDTRPGHAAQLLVYESFGCPRMDMNFKKFQKQKRQNCLFMLMFGDARVLENLNAEDITMTESMEINGHLANSHKKAFNSLGSRLGT